MDDCESHVLFLLDCGHAGSSVSYIHAISTVEAIVASGVGNMTPPRGKDSFTAHLTEVLKELLAEEEWVTVGRLCTMITDRLRSTIWSLEDSRRVSPHHLVFSNAKQNIVLGRAKTPPIVPFNAARSMQSENMIGSSK